MAPLKRAGKEPARLAIAVALKTVNQRELGALRFLRHTGFPNAKKVSRGIYFDKSPGSAFASGSISFTGRSPVTPACSRLAVAAILQKVIQEQVLFGVKADQ